LLRAAGSHATITVVPDAATRSSGSLI
jgi:hypothetical protein